MAEVQESSKTMKAVLDFYNIPWAKASHTAKDDIKGGNKVYSTLSKKGREQICVEQ